MLLPIVFVEIMFNADRLGLISYSDKKITASRIGEGTHGLQDLERFFVAHGLDADIRLELHRVCLTTRQGGIQ